MTAAQEIFNARVTRIKKAIALEKPDKTPFVPMMDAFCAKHMGYKLSDFVSNPELSNKMILDSAKDLGEVDAVSNAVSIQGAMGMNFMCRIKLPGKELPDDALWQMDETELMKPEDYDTIVEKGWTEFSKEYTADRMQVDFDLVKRIGSATPQAAKNLAEAGYPVYRGSMVVHPIDYLSGGRTMTKFMMDMKRMPDKVLEVMDIVVEANIERMKEIKKTAVNPLDVLITMARGCPDFYSMKLWETFIWPYIQKITQACIEVGLPANFHIDANWERGLDRFKEFPKGTCVFETDGMTDIYVIKEKLGDTMCIKGDVQAGKLAIGTPDEVYSYSSQLIRDMGTGFILSGGCTLPPNAKVENVKAMVAAAAGK